MHNTHKMWGLTYSCAMRTMLMSSTCYCTCSAIMCVLHGTCTQASWPPLHKHGAPEITYGHAIHACAYCMAHAHRQAGHPYINMVHQKLLMDMPFMPAEQYLSKISSSHFGTLNMKIANQNMLKRILIAMHNENMANCNENFRICAEEPTAPLYKR